MNHVNFSKGGDRCSIAGWGKSKQVTQGSDQVVVTKKYADVLQTTDVSIWNLKTCKLYYNIPTKIVLGLVRLLIGNYTQFRVTDKNICAGNRDNGVCKVCFSSNNI